MATTLSNPKTPLEIFKSTFPDWKSQKDITLSENGMFGIIPIGHPKFKDITLEPAIVHRLRPSNKEQIQLNREFYDIKHLNTLCQLVLDISITAEKIKNNQLDQKFFDSVKIGYIPHGSTGQPLFIKWQDKYALLVNI